MSTEESFFMLSTSKNRTYSLWLPKSVIFGDKIWALSQKTKKTKKREKEKMLISVQHLFAVSVKTQEVARMT